MPLGTSIAAPSRPSGLLEQPKLLVTREHCSVARIAASLNDETACKFNPLSGYVAPNGPCRARSKDAKSEAVKRRDFEPNRLRLLWRDGGVDSSFNVPFVKSEIGVLAGLIDEEHKYLHLMLSFERIPPVL